MDLTRVILGEVSTEKAERMKVRKVAVLRVHPAASKIDVRNALRRHFGVDAGSIRILHVRPKSRLIARGKMMQKRHPEKRAFVTLDPKSKALDLTSLQT